MGRQMWPTRAGLGKRLTAQPILPQLSNTYSNRTLLLQYRFEGVAV